MESKLMLSRNGVSVPCILTEPEDGDVRRVVLGVHGLGGSAMDGIQQALAEEMDLIYGATLRFDFPAHGQSPMESRDFRLQPCKDSLLAGAAFLWQRFPQAQELCVFATGFGAYITFLCLESLQALGPMKLVVQTPAVLMHKTLLAMARITQPTFQALEQLSFRTERPLTVYYDFYEELLENIALTSHDLPFLILQGQEDDYISMVDIQRLRRINEDSRLVIIPGTSHRFQEDGAWDMVLDLARDWFEFQQILVCDWE